MEDIDLLQIKTRSDLERFNYTPNYNGMRFLEFLALFLCLIAALVYPVTYFEPKAWMIAPIILGLVAIGLFSLVQYWRRYARVSFIAYDKEYLYLVNMGRAKRVRWALLTLQNSGIASNNERAGVFCIQIDGQKVILRLFSSFVWLAQFQEVLGTVLTHIQANSKQIHSHE